MILFRILESRRGAHWRSPASLLGTPTVSIKDLHPKTGQEPNGDLDALPLVSALPHKVWYE
jgi:hypothetical protein